jgi:hypothetical protein
MFAGTFDERCALRVHLRLDLLAHRAAQQIGATERIAGHDLRRLHHLFLIDDDAVGFLQDRLEQGMRIFRIFIAVLAAPEGRDIVHRARPIERDERDDVLEYGRAHRRKRAAHALGFHLEHADRVTALEQFRSLGSSVIERRKIDRQYAFACASISIAFCSTDSVFRPRKSNFTRPAPSTYFMSNWVTGMSDRGSR